MRIAKLIQPIFLVALCFIAAGCFPYHWTTRMPLSGTIVDAETHAPVPGAHIFSGTNETALAVSADDGSFAVPAQKRWMIYFVGEDFFALRWMTAPIHIQCVGYETNQVETFFSHAGQHIQPKTALGVVPLKPLSKTH